jgi:hypothetical protein
MSATTNFFQTQGNGAIWEQRLALATVIRQQLLIAGFMPIPANGKAAVLTGWRNKTSTNPDEIELWPKIYPYAYNTGVVTAWTPFFDIDLMDPEAAGAVEELVRDRFGDRGMILVRFGLSPKRAIPFRITTKSFSKIQKVFLPHGPNPKADKLEFLGDGQQVIVRGIHPDTHKPYRWHDNRYPGDIRRDELPEIGAQEAQALFDDAVALVVRDHGYRLHDALKRTGGAAPRSPRAGFPLLEGFVPDGNRNVDLTRVAGLLFYRGIRLPYVRLILHSLNQTQCQPPKEQSVVDTIVDSIARREEKHRGRRWQPNH